MIFCAIGQLKIINRKDKIFQTVILWYTRQKQNCHMGWITLKLPVFFFYIYILKPKQNLRKILSSWKENVQLQMKQCWVCLSKIIKWCPHNRFKLIPLPFLVGSLTFFCRNQIKPGCTHLGWSQVAFYDAE